MITLRTPLLHFAVIGFAGLSRIVLAAADLPSTPGLGAEATAPLFSYRPTQVPSAPDFQINGQTRVLELKGKRGLNPTSIHTTLEFKRHNLNTSDSGTFVLWAFFLEELNAAHNTHRMTYDNKLWYTYPIIADIPQASNSDSANFGMYFLAEWHPQFYVKMYRGVLYPTRVDPPQKAFVTSEHFSFKANRWYQLTFTWNKKAENLRLYANGILIGTDDKTHGAFYIEKVNDHLFTGNPVICYGDLDFFDRELPEAEVYRLYRQNAPDFSQEYETHLRHVFNGQDIQRFDWKPGNDWSERLNYRMNEPDLLGHFYLQGHKEAVSVTADGLLVETPNLPQQGNTIEKQVYVWPKAFFEGDLYIEYEFMPLREGGLSLLMAQASGMNRERFMSDYPPRTNGNMSTVLGQGVRNYHWEYFREMNDVRNDIASGGLIKNPFQYPLAYGTFDRNLQQNHWHKLQFLQIGPKIVGAIDGQIIIDALDDSNTNNGPVLNSGYMAIRCMIRTKMLFRNLKVYNRPPPFQVVAPLP